MRIREATVQDAGAIARVHVDSWRETYAGIVPDDYLANLCHEQRERVWRASLSNHCVKECVYVAESDPGGIIGFVSGGPERKGESAYKGELYAIYVLEAYQRKGIGRKLTQTIARRLHQDRLHSMLVWVLADNRSKDFYNALGGQLLYEREIDIGGLRLVEEAYGWPDIHELATVQR